MKEQETRTILYTSFKREENGSTTTNNSYKMITRKLGVISVVTRCPLVRLAAQDAGRSNLSLSINKQQRSLGCEVRVRDWKITSCVYEQVGCQHREWGSLSSLNVTPEWYSKDKETMDLNFNEDLHDALRLKNDGDRNQEKAQLQSHDVATS